MDIGYYIVHYRELVEVPQYRAQSNKKILMASKVVALGGHVNKCYME